MTEQTEKRQLHNIAPVWDENSKILILGSFPSVRSRGEGFFYAHPQNRFWRVCSAVFDAPVPLSTDDKKQFLLSHGIALWDVVSGCEIRGSSDSTIHGACANDISALFTASDIKKVYVNGSTAARLYDRLILPKLGIRAVKLPSTSPANAAWSFEKLCDAWSIITKA